ncbi:MAG: peptidyl-prolyl cis-trans isomerase [Candidatus Eisenbacteria bacterium]
MNARRALSLLVIVACAAQAALALAQSRGAATAPAKPAPAAAVVAGRRIPSADLDRRTAQAAAEFAQRNGNRELTPEMRDMLRRQVLEALIRAEILVAEAKRRGVTASEAEAEQLMRQDPFFNPGGVFDEQRFLAVKTTQKARYDLAIAAIREQLAGRKLGDELQARYVPSEAKARAQALRSMSRVTAEHFTLRRADFDGGFPEPRESEVLAYYRAHAGDYQRPDRATLTIAFVNSPGLGDEDKRDPARVAAWNRRMKESADSLIAVIAAGTDFEKAAASLTPRPGVVVAADNFPGYWRGTDAQNRKLFEPGRAGTILREAIECEEGWMVVKITDVDPAHVAPVREVAREIRGLLRRDRKRHAEDYALRDVFEGMRDSLSGPGWQVRWVAFDTARVRVPEPTAAELDRYYRGHLADYSSFDPAAGGVVARPYDAVKEDVRVRFLRERRSSEARLAADRVERAWAVGKRDPASEAMGVVREKAVPLGADFDSTLEGRVLADSVWSQQPPRGGLVTLRSGWLVWRAIAPVEKATPEFGMVRGLLAERRKALVAEDELAGARRLYDADPRRFGHGDGISFTRMVVSPPPMLQIPLTRDEVERYHKANLDKYSAPELVRARHILIEPHGHTADAEATARKSAEALLARVRNGEDFVELAKQYSADVATRDKGGDLGVFQRGTMLEPIERVAFSLQAGDLAPELVHTEVGYHIVQVTEHEPAVVQPLAWLYAAVSSDAALAKGLVLAKNTADSILRVARRPAELRRIASRLGYTLISDVHRTGDYPATGVVRPLLEDVEKLRPGQVLAEPFAVKSQGFWIVWVDSISPPATPTWDEARPYALDAYRRGAGERALAAKRAELDSLMAAGWAVDSLAALWAGPERARDLPAGKGLSGMGGAATFDSLAFGTDRTAALEAGRWSDWLAFPNGMSRFRVTDRFAPSNTQLNERVASIRTAEAELGLRQFFEDARKRYGVQILEARMRQVELPTPGASSTP